MSPEGEMFGSQRVLDLIRDHRHMTAQQITEVLYAEVQAFSRQEKLADDVTAVVIKVEPAA
jgi:serine phosphatase RsbU (regulator of sigma subunit)